MNWENFVAKVILLMGTFFKSSFAKSENFMKNVELSRGEFYAKSGFIKGLNKL